MSDNTKSKSANADSTYRFLQGKEDALGKVQQDASADPSAVWREQAAGTRAKLAQALNGRHVSFLLGSGTSSQLDKEERELGIPTMGPLAKQFLDPAYADGVPIDQRSRLMEAFGLNIADAAYAKNLETLMGRLLALQFGFTQPASSSGISAAKDTRRDLSSDVGESPDVPQTVHTSNLALVNTVIERLRKFLVKKVTEGEFSNGNTTVLDTYQRFYRRLVFRERSLPRPWIFTTNYDLFSEMALDRLGVLYSNGFSGTIDRRFNPAVYRYALAEEIDVASKKWSAVDGYIYLCKLHGSVNWVAGGDGLYPVRELSGPSTTEPAIIFPTPAKQGTTLSSPYAEQFRQFQEQIVREQSVLFVIGYSFGDDHVNNIIFQALSIPTFRLVIFADPTQGGEIGKLRELDDPRIWIIGGTSPDGDKLHYFVSAVEHLLPDLPSERIDEAIQKVERLLVRRGDA